MNKTLEKILEDELFDNEVFEGEGSLQIKNTSEGTKIPITVSGNSVQEGEPTPENPIEIKNCGDNINLFNKEGNNGNGFLTADGTIQENNNFKTSDYIELNTLRKNITISGNAGKNEINCFYNSEKTFISQFNMSTNTTITQAIPKDAKYIKVTVYNNVLDNYKIEYGTKASPYSPYNCGKLNIIVSNKNLINLLNNVNKNIDGLTVSVNDSTGYITVNGTPTKDYVRIVKNTDITNILKVGKTYTLWQEKHTDNEKNIYLQVTEHENYDINNNRFILSRDRNISFTVKENTQYILSLQTSIMSDIGTFDNTKNRYMFLEGELKDNETYLLHQSQTVAFPIKEGQVLHKGDYLASDGVHQIRDKLVFLSTDAWEWTPKHINGCFSLLRYPERASGVKPYCTNLIGVDGSNWEQTTMPNSIGLGADRFNVYIPSATSPEECKEIMNGQTVEYMLKNEKIEPYTKEQRTAYDQLMQATAYDEITNIICTDEVQCNFTVNAKISKIKKIKEETKI